MSRCLGDLLAPLADGSLAAAQAERALAHVAVCASCRRELAEERRVRALLSGVDVPEVPAALLVALTTIPDRPVVPTAPGLVPPPPFGAGAPSSPAPTRAPAPRMGPLTAGAMVAVAASAGLALLAGAPQAATSVPVVVPDPVGFAQEHAAVVGRVGVSGSGVPASDPLPAPARSGTGSPASIAAAGPGALLAAVPSAKVSDRPDLRRSDVTGPVLAAAVLPAAFLDAPASPPASTSASTPAPASGAPAADARSAPSASPVAAPAPTAGP